MPPPIRTPEGAGYDPEHGDWFWLKQAPDGTVQAPDTLESCQHCQAKGSDFIRGDDIGS